LVARALRARDSVRAGEELDLNALLMELTLGIAGETLFSADVARDAPVVREALDVAMQLFTMARRPRDDFQRSGLDVLVPLAKPCRLRSGCTPTWSRRWRAARRAAPV
jgi:hypothetical protein